jgi:hypothetical protein
VLGGEQRPRAQDLAGQAGVLGRHEVRDGAGRAFARQGEHLRAERGEHQGVLRDAAGAQRVHVGGEGLVRIPVRPCRFPVPRADAEHEAARMTVLHPGERAGHVVRAVLPHVHDAGAQGQGAGRVEQFLRLGQVAVGRAAEPERAEAGLLDGGGQLSRRLIGTPPDPEPS